MASEEKTEIKVKKVKMIRHKGRKCDSDYILGKSLKLFVNIFIFSSLHFIFVISDDIPIGFDQLPRYN